MLLKMTRPLQFPGKPRANTSRRHCCLVTRTYTNLSSTRCVLGETNPVAPARSHLEPEKVRISRVSRNTIWSLVQTYFRFRLWHHISVISYIYWADKYYPNVISDIIYQYCIYQVCETLTSEISIYMHKILYYYLSEYSELVTLKSLQESLLNCDELCPR